MKPEIASLFIERFPRYAFEIREWAPSTQKAPPLDLETLPLETARVLYLYGLSSQAAQQLLPWLLEKKERRLVFLEPNGSIIASFLEEEEAKTILSQPQIEIYHLPKQEKKRALIHELSCRHAVRDVFICYGHGSRREFFQLKLALLKATAVTYAYHVETLHAPSILSNLKNNVNALSSSFCVESLKDTFQSIPAIICGAGPSLQRSLDTLRTLRHKALIFAGGSAIAALSNQGIDPHFAVAIDPNEEEFKRLKNSSALQTPFLFTLRLHSNCLAVSNGPLGFVRATLAGRLPNWIEKEIGLKKPPIGKDLPLESFSVTTLAAALALHFGCNPILFDGIDLAYTDNQRYANGIAATPDEELLSPFDRPLQKKSRSKKSIESAVRWVIEAHTLSRLAKRRPDRRWIQCTAEGLPLKGIETMPLAQAAALFSEERDLSGLIHQAISSSPMPKTAAPLYMQKIEELKNSLDRVLGYLDDLVEERPGLAGLAELEMPEELIYRLLFSHALLAIQACSSDIGGKRDLWRALQRVALSCKENLRHVLFESSL